MDQRSLERPLQIYKANAALQLKIAELLQENSQEWLLESARICYGNRTSESQASMKKLLDSKDWQSLSSVPGESLGQFVHQQLGSLQAIHELTLRQQTELMGSIGKAFEAWQKALGEFHERPSQPEWVSQWQSLWASWHRPLEEQAQKASSALAKEKIKS